MSTVIHRSDRFPIGTAVGVYPALSSHEHAAGVGPNGSALETPTVDAFGALTLSLEDGVPYVLYAQVSGEKRYLQVASGAYTAPGTLAERIAAKRAEVGA